MKKITFLDEISSLKRLFFGCDDLDKYLKLTISSWYSLMEREDRLTAYVSLFNMCATYNWPKQKCADLIMQSDKDKNVLEYMLQLVYQQLEGESTSPERIKRFEMPLGVKEPQVLILYRFIATMWEYLDDLSNLPLKREALKYFNQLDRNHQNYILLDRIYEYDLFLPKLVSGGPFYNGSNCISPEFKQTPLGRKSLLNLQILVKCDNQTLDSKINEIAYSSEKLKKSDELFWIQKLVRAWTRTYQEKEKVNQMSQYNTLFSIALKRSERWSKSDAYNSITSLDLWIKGCLDQEDDLSIEYVRYKIIKDLYAPFEKKYYEDKSPFNYTTKQAMAARLYKPLKEIRNITTHTKQEKIKDRTLFRLLLCIGLRYIHESLDKNLSMELLEGERELCVELNKSWFDNESFDDEAKKILWYWYLCIMNASNNTSHKLISTDALMRELKKGLVPIRNGEKNDTAIELYGYEWMIKWLCIKVTNCRVENINFFENESRGNLVASFYSSEMHRMTPMLFEILMAYLKYAMDKEKIMNETLNIYL